ncbi:Histidine kinase-, DNA gyrase B-, and HSP90-like ATPase [Arenibacter palladensis]|uniref:histidine kinase n=1 Tax=Arenibacter palladensis TaxID=237373 RepID=A0A1M4Y3M4_9FLAO|nr:ATP-binding protein [Arenibacter palladensis]SHF00183.1 Histidine kinase-, DNA gyrase B-, and HSP90-like ATPase [Arenibacter palladensis]
MVSKNFYFQTIGRVIFITATSLMLAFLLARENYVFGILTLIALVFQAYYLIRYVNETNRKIAYFFDAIKNEDFTLRFPEKLTLKSLEELNHSLNMLNEMIQKIHLKNQTQERFYQEILKQADIGILAINKKGHILFANPRLEHMLNYTPLNHIKQLSQIDENLYRVFSELKPFERRMFQLTNEREKIDLAIKSSSFNLDDQELLLVVIQDIHQELDEKETESWTRLIRVLTHEIMNSITPITSISDSILKYQTLADKNPVDETSYQKRLENTIKGLEVIKDQGANLMSFVQSYRSFLNVPLPDKKIVRVQNLLEKVIMLMGQDKKFSNTSIELLMDDQDLELFIDEKQITQVLINLSRNALQSMEQLKNSSLKLIAGINNAGQKYIEVKDNGPGIPHELINEIFVPFFTTKNSGTGVGLSLSKQILRMHGGNLKLNSIPNKETSFFLIF